MARRTLTGAQILWEALVAKASRSCSAIPAARSCPPTTRCSTTRIHHVLVRHEQGAAHMADGYARASGKVGVAIATSGPGATNLVTGIATAMLDSVPMVCITGQVASTLIGSDAFQETDITGVTLPITKHNYLVTRADEIAPTHPRGVLHRALGAPRPGARRHHEGRAAGDAASRRVERRAGRLPRLPPRAPRAASTSSRAPREMIDAAKRPVILAGHGIVQGRARARCSREFVEQDRHSRSPRRCSGSAASRRRHPLASA